MKMVVQEVNRKKYVDLCKERKNWQVVCQWDKMVFTDESQVEIGNNNWVYIWRKADEADRPDCVLPPKRPWVFWVGAHNQVCVMIWEACFCGYGTMCLVDSNINALDNNLWL